MKKLIFMLIITLAMTITPMFAEMVSPVDPGLSTIASFNTAPVVESTLTVQAAEIINSESMIIRVLQIAVLSLIITALVVSIPLIITSLRLGNRSRKKRGVLAFAGED